MTIGAQVKQTLASLKGIEATLETFAAMEQNRETRAVMERNAGRIGDIVKDLEKRIGALEFEEPQYKGF